MSAASEIVSLYQVDKVYPPKQIALRNLDLKIRSGEFVFVAGGSGAGKSTLLRLIFAAERATRGQVLVGGKNLQTINNHDVSKLRQHIGFIFQDYRLIKSMTVLENVAFVLETLGVKKSERNSRAEYVLSLLGLKDRISDYPRMLSGGEQQRVAVARALISRPKLILADEPTGNLDPDLTAAVFSLLLETCSYGTTVIVASHNLKLIEQLNRRTIVLDKGRLVGDFEHPAGV